MLDCGFTKEDNWFRYRAGAIIIEDDCVLLAKNENDDYYYSVGGGVHMNEKAEEAVLREVFEETGIQYEIDRLIVVHENFFEGDGCILGGLHCHEIAFFYLMKSQGIKEIHTDSYTHGVKENMHWIPIRDLDKYIVFPSWLKDYLGKEHNGIEHIITDERVCNKGV